ncbi:MAG TPA: Hsp20/alpha crystallin family protein [Pirellulales bacterium]|jgi:HSP20 family protein
MAGLLTTREPHARRRWLEPFASLREEFGDLATNFLTDVSEAWPRGLMVPSLDVSESNGAIEVRMDLPGIKAEEIDVQLTDNILTVSGQRREEKEEKGKTYHRVERHHGSFSRTVALPCSVDEAKVDAQYKDGVLTIKIPKTDAAKACKIKVHA